MEILTPANIKFEDALSTYEKKNIKTDLQSDQKNSKNTFKCFGTIMKQRIELGSITANNKEETTQKSVNMLEQQGTLEAFTQFTCE